ncbi:LysR family transcriptional regulator [Novosphingobium sp. 1949]|uniref:LysR family transcriptional regulator n=1 Tax=Novosphingobium organovorum TaxID=2930092 RepID=A0ABT0BEW5_9SPHN|nr:LysR family transcriptional regulator [Novosphingobium organovorum]MCJ2183598.1 LysR family transcriptional regulator [Novosphingobium organovorum]
MAMRFGRLDLNLLVALDALLTECSVSLAADRLCLSQSATSSALGRLRDYFGDELLVVKGRQMVLTARAEELIEPVRAVLEQIRATITVAPPFDPATAERQISIMASDYSTQVLLTQALAEMEAKAPGIRFEIQPMNDNPIDTLERGYVDLLLTIDYAISTDHPSQVLFEDDYVVLGWKGNPAMDGPMTREKYFSLGHVTARFGKSRVAAFDDWFVRRQKQQRKVEVVAPTFLSLAGLVMNTNRIATVHRRMAESFTRSMPLVMRETPFDIPPIRETVQWHITNSNDAALRWVVEQMAAASQRTAGADNIVPFEPGSPDAVDRERIEYEFRMNQAKPRG